MAETRCRPTTSIAELLSFNAANLGGLSGWIREIAERVRKDPAASSIVRQRTRRDCLKLAARHSCSRRFAAMSVLRNCGQDRDVLSGRRQDRGVAQATGDLVEVVLNSPHFLFRKELDVDRRQPPVARAIAAGRDLHARRCAAGSCCSSTRARPTHTCETAPRRRRRISDMLAVEGSARKTGALLQGMAGNQGARRFHDLAGAVSRVQRRAGRRHASRRRTRSCAPQLKPAPRSTDITQADADVRLEGRSRRSIGVKAASADGAKPVDARSDTAAWHLLAAGRFRLAFGADQFAADQTRRVLGAQGDVHGDGAAAATDCMPRSTKCRAPPSAQRIET